MRHILFLTLFMLLFSSTTWAGPIDDLDRATVLIQEKKYDQAKALLFPLTSDQSTSVSIKSEAYFLLSFCTSDLAEQKNYAKKSLDLDTSRGIVYRRYGSILLHSKQYEEAVNALGTALERAPDDAAAYALRSLCYIQQDRLGLAMTDINKSLSLNAKNGDFYFIRGKIYFLSDAKAKAKEDFGQALRFGMKKDLATCYSYIGRIEESDHKMKEAIRAYSMALSLEQNSIIKCTLEKKITSLKSILKWNS